MCGLASCWAWCALLFITVGFILDTVGVFTNSWMVNTDSGVTTRIGLWNSQACSSTTCTHVTTPDSFKNSNFRGTQAMEVIAFIMFLVAPVGVSLFVCCINLRTRRKACYCMILCFICAFFVTVGMIIWLVYIYSPYSVGYSFGLTTLAGIFAIIAGLCLIPEIENDDDEYDYYDDRARRSVSPDYYQRDSRIRPSSPRYPPRTPISDSPSGYPPRTPRSDSSLQRAVSPIPARSVSRNPATPAGPVTYNSMPAAMTPDPSDTMYNTKGFRPATFNDVSNITLQRDRAVY